MNQRQHECSLCHKIKPRSAFHEDAHKDRTRDVYSRCRECRSDIYFAKRFSTVCAQCLKYRQLDQNGICGKCNEESGLRECRGPCGNLLPSFLEFYGTRKKCKKCQKQLRGK